MFIKPVKYLLMAVVVAACAAGLASLGGYIGGTVLGGGDFAALGLAILGLTVGYLVGIMLGLSLIKAVFHQPGSLLLGIGGAIVGFAVPIAIVQFAGFSDSGSWFLSLLFVCIPLFSLGGFLLGREDS